MGEPVWALGSFGLDRMDKIFPESPPPPKKKIFVTVLARMFIGEGGRDGRGRRISPGKFKYPPDTPPRKNGLDPRML